MKFPQASGNWSGSLWSSPQGVPGSQRLSSGAAPAPRDCGYTGHVPTSGRPGRAQGTGPVAGTRAAPSSAEASLLAQNRGEHSGEPRSWCPPQGPRVSKAVGEDGGFAT